MTDLLDQEQARSDSLPSGWARTTVGDLYKMVGGGTPDTKKPEYWDGDIPWISSADIHALRKVTPRRSITQLGINSSATNLVPEGSLIIVTRVGLGKVAIAPIELCFSQDSQALVENNYIFRDYALHYLSTAVQSFKHQSRGTTISGVTKKQLSELPFLLPPLNEQRRIVEKVEELFTKLDAGVRSLKQTQALLKSYRRSVLKAAVEGELSREWREAHRNELEPASELLARILQERREKFAGKKYKEPAPPDISQLPVLPDGWEWANFERLAHARPHALKAGPFGSALKKSYYVPHGYKIYGQEQVLRGDAHYGDYYIDEKRYRDLDSCAVAPGDILISLVGTIGQVLILPDNIEPGIINPRLVKLSLDKHLVDPRYIKILLTAPVIKEYFARSAHGGTMDILNLTILKQLPIPLPSLEEQRFIVEEVERRLSVVDKLEATVEANLKQADGLRQSILKQAFSGELVPQDPDDEPASLLLERIRSERQAAKPKARKGRKANARPANSAHAEQGGLF